jgi:hypothetical protein
MIVDEPTVVHVTAAVFTVTPDGGVPAFPLNVGELEP